MAIRLDPSSGRNGDTGIDLKNSQRENPSLDNVNKAASSQFANLDLDRVAPSKMEKKVTHEKRDSDNEQSLDASSETDSSDAESYPEAVFHQPIPEEIRRYASTFVNKLELFFNNSSMTNKANMCINIMDLTNKLDLVPSILITAYSYLKRMAGSSEFTRHEPSQLMAALLCLAHKWSEDKWHKSWNYAKILDISAANFNAIERDCAKALGYNLYIDPAEYENLLSEFAESNVEELHRDASMYVEKSEPFFNSLSMMNKENLRIIILDLAKQLDPSILITAYSYLKRMAGSSEFTRHDPSHLMTALMCLAEKWLKDNPRLNSDWAEFLDIPAANFNAIESDCFKALGYKLSIDLAEYENLLSEFSGSTFC